MERFLSPAWFTRLAAGAPAAGAGGDIVLQQVVTGAPEDEIRYQVSVSDGRATIHRGSPAKADMTFTSDYETAAAIAGGTLSTETALSEGRIGVSGNLSRLDVDQPLLGGLDPLGAFRSDTDFGVNAGQGRSPDG